MNCGYNNDILSGVCDSPITKWEDDKLDASLYAKALCAFIRQCETPMSVAIQGDWGSGKTSLMKLVESELCQNNNSQGFRQFESIWLDTWDWLLEPKDDTAVKFLVGDLFDELSKLTGDSTIPRQRDKIRTSIRRNGLLNRFRTTVRKRAKDDAATIPERAVAYVDEIFFGYNIKEYRDSVAKGIKSHIADVRNRASNLLSEDCESDYYSEEFKGILIFVDDLDRLDPRRALTILEALKLLFDIEGLYFLVAINRDIIQLGAQQKYGLLELENRDISNSFFDKIFQLEVNVSTRRYHTNKLIHILLKRIGFLPEDYYEINTETYEPQKDTTRTAFDIINISTSGNPRLIKSVINSLIFTMDVFYNNSQLNEGIHGEYVEVIERLLLLLLVCVDRTHPRLFRWLLEEVLTDNDKNYHDALRDKSELYLLSQFESLSEQYILMGGNTKNLMRSIKVFDSASGFPIRYDGIDYEASHHYQKATENRLFERLATFDMHSWNVLDIGCGNGDTTIALWSMNYSMSILAIDISLSQLAVAEERYKRYKERHDYADRKTGGIEFKYMDVLELDAVNEYDLAFSNYAMHWVLQPFDAYSRILRSLRPGGILAIQQGCAGGFEGLHSLARQTILDLGFCDKDELDNWTFPKWSPTLDEFNSVLSEVGFIDIDSQLIKENLIATNELAKDFSVASLIFYKDRGVLAHKGEKVDNNELERRFFELTNEFLERCTSCDYDSSDCNIIAVARKPSSSPLTSIKPFLSTLKDKLS